MDPITIINEIAMKAAPGKPPAYMAAHVLKALELIGAGLGIGRQQIARELGVGEGTARTLLRRMREEGLVEVHRGGVILSAKGAEVLSSLVRLIASTELPTSKITVGSLNYAIRVKGAGGYIKHGVEQRDAALRAGAEGATTLLFDGRRFHAPGLEVNLPDELTKLLVERLRVEEGDAVIIGSAEDSHSAEMGAKTAALHLLERIGDKALK